LIRCLTLETCFIHKQIILMISNSILYINFISGPSEITLQKLFLDILAGKQVGPSGDRLVHPKFELNRTLVAITNERTPVKGIFQGSAARCVPVARDLLTKGLLL